MATERILRRSGIRATASLLVALCCFPFATASDVDAQFENQFTIELPVPAPIVLVSQDGHFAVCAQWIDTSMKWRKEVAGSNLIRLFVVDLDQRSIIASRDLPSTEIRLAVGPGEIYVADHGLMKLRVLSLANLSDTREVVLEKKVDELVLIPGKLLCSADGQQRWDLPELTPSKKWESLGAGDPVLPVEGGWYLDGVIFDASLERARMVANSPFAPNAASSPFKLSDGIQWYHYWGLPVKELILDGFHTTNSVVNHEHPFAVHVQVPQQKNWQAAIPIRIAIEHLGHEVIATAAAGEFAPGNVLLALPPKRDAAHPLIKYRYADSHKIPVPVATVGRRVVVIVDGRLFVWDLDQSLVAGLVGPLRFSLEQTRFVEFEDTVQLAEKPHGGKPPFSLRTDDQEVEMKFSPRKQITKGWPQSSEKQNIERFFDLYEPGHPLRIPDDVEQSKKQWSRFFERVMGRPNTGLVYAWRRSIKAESTQKGGAVLSYYVLSDMPESFYGPIYKERFEKTRLSLIEHQKQLEQQGLAAVKQQRQMARQLAWQSNKVVLDKWATQITYVAGALAVAFVISVIVRAFLSSTRLSRMPGLRFYGIANAALGTVPLIISALFAMIADSLESRAIPFPVFGFLVATSFSFLYVMLVWGSIDIARFKGYSPVMGFLVGLIPVLGLLLMVLLSEVSKDGQKPTGTPMQSQRLKRRSDSAADEVG